VKSEAKRALTTLSALILLPATAGLSGGGMGGGGPPAIHRLEELLAASESINGGLYSDIDGTIKLGVRTKLDDAMVVSLSPQKGTAAIRLQEEDFKRLLNSEASVIEAKELEYPALLENPTEARNRSYKIEFGNQYDEIVLMDRRVDIRNAAAAE
jgi:hypothetical protein